MFSTCCPAHINTVFDFVPNILQKKLISFCNSYWYSILQVVVGKAGEQGFFKVFSTHLAAVRSTRGSPDVFTSFNFADEPAEHDQLFTHSA
jgi:hypothetical protein